MSRYVDLDERVTAQFYDEECEEWTMRTVTIQDVLDSVCDDYTVLPSAQQTALTADDIETIRIHLSAFKEKLCNQGRWTEATEYERLIQRLIGKGGQDEGNAVR